MDLHVTRHIRRRARPLTDERGFTMVELLVVILIISILAVIALPAFLNQRAKGQDSEAKLMLRTATTAMATHEIDTETFDADPAKLIALEPSLAEARNFTAAGTKDTYDLSLSSRSGTTFTVRRDAAETLARTCSQHGIGLCRNTADANGNWW
jgi:type IV pilus assembly protein PilA